MIVHTFLPPAPCWQAFEKYLEDLKRGPSGQLLAMHRHEARLVNRTIERSCVLLQVKLQGNVALQEVLYGELVLPVWPHEQLGAALRSIQEACALERGLPSVASVKIAMAKNWSKDHMHVPLDVGFGTPLMLLGGGSSVHLTLEISGSGSRRAADGTPSFPAMWASWNSPFWSAVAPAPGAYARIYH